MAQVTPGGSGHLTEKGARRLGLPHLKGAQVTWVGIDTQNQCVGTLYYEGTRLGRNLSYQGEDRGVDLEEI